MTGSLFAGASVEENVPLAPLTTLRVGPVARRMVTCTTTEQVVAALSGLRDEGVDPLVLGGGSNVVIDDRLTGLTVVRLANARITIDGNMIRAEAGAEWDAVVQAAIGAGLGGLECLSGIPGSAGATPVQNVGAYGAEVADTARRRAISTTVATDELRWVPASDLGFGYRTSIAQAPPSGRRRRSRCEVEFALDATGRSAPLRYGELATRAGRRRAERADPARVRDAVLALRRRKGMVLDAADHDTWSVGSFFTNPVVTPRTVRGAAGRGDRSGAQLSGRGRREAGRGLAGGARRLRQGLSRRRCCGRVSGKHALALTNRGDRHQRGRRRLGAPGPRRGGRRVRYPAGARTGADRRCDLILRI